MIHKIFDDYKSAIKKAGFDIIGKVISLDEKETAKDGKIGIGMECLDRDLWDFEPVLTEIKKLGIHIARLQSGWQKTEKTEGIYDFEWLDNVVDKLILNGIEPFLCLCYGNKLYCDNPQDFPNIEHGGVGHFPINTERERNAWLSYVENTVNHFKDRVKYFEIWNEPDVSVFLTTQEVWCETYMEFVKITAPVIRKNAPDAVVVSCTAGLTQGEMLTDRGVADYVDIHSFHGYNAWPELCRGEQKSIESYIKNKAPHLGIWRGEAGFPSYNDPRSKGALSGRYVSEIMQAKFIMRHIVCDMSNNLLDKTFYFHAYDFEHFMKIVRYHYGLLRHEEPRRKPSYYVLQMLAHLFDGKVVSRDDIKMSTVCKDNIPENELSAQQKLGLEFFTFEKNGNVFFTYCNPAEIKDDTFVSKTLLTLPYVENMNNPVIIDTLTREIYPVSNPRRFYAPVTDYPMIVTDADSLRDIIELSSEINSEKAKEDLTQRYEE